MHRDNRDFFVQSQRMIAALSLAVIIISFLQMRIAGGFVLDGQGLILGRDFLNFWHYGIAAWSADPAQYYDVYFYNNLLDGLIFVHDYADQQFSYPPHYMLLAAPFGLLGYHAALLIFTALGVGLLWAVVARPMGESISQRQLFLAPMFVFTLICGQVSLFVLVLFVAIYRNLDRRPLLAGLLIALLTVKPQIGLLFPVFLLLTARWRVFAATAIGTIGMVGLSLVWHGSEVWRVYLETGIAQQSQTMVNLPAFTRGLMPTVFVNMQIVNAPDWLAYGAQMLVIAAAVVALVWVCRFCRDRFSQYAVFVAASFAVTPYLMAYDTIVLVWVMIALASRYRFDAAAKLLFIALAAVGPLGVVLSLLGVPGSALVLLGVLVFSISCAKETSGDQSEAHLRDLAAAQ